MSLCQCSLGDYAGISGSNSKFDNYVSYRKLLTLNSSLRAVHYYYSSEITFNYTLYDEESCYVFSTRNNCCEFLASYGVNLRRFY